ncbi:FAD binding domain-containing protein [Halorientalis pallida]|uniref:Xanthine dehydrogenase family protein subunit M n=1 Tax=Halorientalis pallida TaxID=2479928 RepID=A0A498KUR0_9EURY|nr:xanthine dehydrogenase family protein subunit M [Halorientalis pallida]RXK47984.1 xanthine dehydrogenase family protein subunit M [Halorientalis pallida]
MHPGTYEYLSAESVDHALDLLVDHPDAELLAGGHSLLPAITNEAADPDVVVDISEIDAIRGIEVTDDVVEIGAVTTYAELQDAARLRDAATAVAEAVSVIGDEQVRNRGTIGGNLAHPVRVSDLSAAIIASDATIVTVGPHSERRIAAADFFAPNPATDLAADELLTTVEIPASTGETGGAYVKQQSVTMRYSLLGVAARMTVEGDRVSAIRVAANGVTERGVGLEPVEDTLRGERLDGDTIETAASRALDGIDTEAMIDDDQASAAYRADLLPTYTEQALETAAERAGVDVPA